MRSYRFDNIKQYQRPCIFVLALLMEYLLYFKAGDTTSTALNFLFLMVAMHPKVQELIVDELNEVFGKQQQCKDLIIDYGNLSQLKYVDMVIKETLRLYSPATGIFREVKADVDLGMENVFQSHCFPTPTLVDVFFLFLFCT